MRCERLYIWYLFSPKGGNYKARLSPTRNPRIIFEENSGLASVVAVDYIQEVINNAVARAAEPLPSEVSPDLN
jgi:hypothetical protein